MNCETDFEIRYNYFLEIINKSLDGYMIFNESPQQIIFNSMRYSLVSGGKRLRPILAFAVSDILNGNIEDVIPFACAIEMIHTYSLIHDDLPSMDNDDYRRGRLTNHKVFGESLAILTGDALLNYAFEIMSEHALKSKKNIISIIKAMNLIVKASGKSGMIGGQVIDLQSEQKMISNELLEKMHKLKTGELIKVPILVSAIICNASDKEMSVLEVYAQKIGMAFQIKDDILDIEGNDEILGKKTGSDKKNNKSTFITVYGLDKSKKILRETIDEAIEVISIFKGREIFLKNLAEFLLKRQK